MKSTDKDYYIEHVCVSCPGSLWGKKSMCRVHEKHISSVDACPSWEEDGYHNSDSVEDLEDKYEKVQLAEEWIKDYQWMTEEIKRIEESLEDIEGSITTEYGVEASLPKPQGMNSDKTGRQAQQRIKLANRLEGLKIKITKIEAAIETFTDQKELAIIECLLDGVTNKSIARHLGVSRQKYYQMKRSIIAKFAAKI